MRLLLDRHDHETPYFVAIETEKDFETIDPIECPPTNVPELLYRVMLGNSNADMYLWNEYYLANLGMAKWYKQQADDRGELVLWDLSPQH